MQSTTFMPHYSRLDVVLVRYPFSDLTSAKVRPAVVVNSSHSSQDLFVVALTSKTSRLVAGEFVLTEWGAASLNVETAVKRGIYTLQETLVRKRVGRLEDADAKQLEKSLRGWLDLPQTFGKYRSAEQVDRTTRRRQQLFKP